MAGTGMALRRGTNHGMEAGDDVQSSIELLDRVLSEFDDLENANQVQNVSNLSYQMQQFEATGASTNGGNVSSTPEDESPSLGGHQSEDDGYMSMNGKKSKFTLSFKPVTEAPVHQETNADEANDFPPPPEEAERLISTLLPRVSPANSSKRNSGRRQRVQNQPLEMNTAPLPTRQIEEINHIINNQYSPLHTATQTTLPKTRHQRPYGWENQQEPLKHFRLHPAPGYRFASLPSSHPVTSPTRVPPRTVPTVVERHREVRRCNESEENLSLSDIEPEQQQAIRPLSELADDERFSDDSLEEMLPPPPPTANKRGSIAWEVPLDDDPLLTPGSTKVVGRRRRKSGENSQSSTSSIPNRLKEIEQDWPDPPPCNTEDEVVSPFSDSDQDPVILPEELSNKDLSGSSTYIIRRGKKDRKPIPANGSISSLNSRLSSDLSIPHSRFSGELSTRLSQNLQASNSRYSIDLERQISQELLSSPKSRYSLDLNSSQIVDSPSRNSLSSDRSSGRLPLDFGNKHSTTFDNIKSLMKEGIIEHCDPHQETVQDFINPNSPIVRVVSLPTLSSDEYTPTRRELAVTVEEEEDIESPRQNSNEISPLRKIEQNISELLERRDIDERDLMNMELPYIQGRSRAQHQQRAEEYYRQLLKDQAHQYSPQPAKRSIQKSESAKEMLLAHHSAHEKSQMSCSTSVDFPVKVDVVQHDFPPLPPSPVEEDDEYSEILAPLQLKTRADTLPVMPSDYYGEPPIVPPHRDQVVPTNSLKTRSMDAGMSRGRRSNNLTSSHRSCSIQERRTLPTDLPGTKRRPFQKREHHVPESGHHHMQMQTSCSLPETPIFARGCDIPRTPHRKAPEVPERTQLGASVHRTTPSPTVQTLGHVSTSGSTYGRRGLSNNNLEQALVGAELLRLAGGPGRGWYPRHRHPRPASIEHLDRLTPSHGRWDATSRKPLTLPPNLTPKFFQRSPREALRRVTSLLIRKGNSSKEPKKEKEQPPVTSSGHAEEGQKKKGFFKNLWKRSRHYSLEQQ